MPRFILALLFVLLPAVAAAQSQVPSIRDIIELSRAGLSDDVLVALIEVHQPVYPVDADTLKRLKDAGVSPDVIVAMVRSGREKPAAASEPTAVEIARPEPSPPQVVVIEREVAPRVREVAVPVPVYVAVPAGVHRRLPPPRVEPVYWGFGGKLRPDAWKPSVEDVQPDAKIPREPQKK